MRIHDSVDLLLKLMQESIVTTYLSAGPGKKLCFKFLFQHVLAKMVKCGRGKKKIQQVGKNPTNVFIFFKKLKGISSG